MATPNSKGSRPAPVGPMMSTRAQGKRLCKRCQKIDLDRAFQTKSPTKAGSPIRALGSIAKWKVDSCPLCELMFKAAGQLQDSKTRVLRRFSTRRIPEWGWQSIDAIILSADSPFLVSQPRGVRHVRILDQHLSIEVVKEWTSVCSKWHTKSCGPRGFLSPSFLIISFKLIDCNTRQIISRNDNQGNDHPYVALSYLWGKPTKKSRFYKALPNTLPQTIEDALQVTKQLGYRYIWIDRFCINQESDEEKQEQFPNMDVIYSNAQITIIAAAGDGPDHGLPGITPRAPNQPSVRIGKHSLVSAMKDPMSSILQSTWNTRGWTYQEGILSCRRLIFTDEQTYFECRSMYCCEALNFPLQYLHTQDQQRFKAAFCNDSNVGIFPKSFGSTAWEVVDRIEEYTKRMLSHPSDILNALLGVLKAVENGPRNVRHCFGVPILPSPPRSRTTKDDDSDTRNVDYSPYVWSPMAGFCTGLCWDVDKPVHRRPGFPSWSWVGWIGNIHWAFQKFQWGNIRGNTDLRVQFQLHDGRIAAWNEFELAYQNFMPQLSGKLHISAWITPLRILAVGLRQVETEVDGIDGQRFSWCFSATTTDSRLFASESLAIHLTQDRRETLGFTGIFVMVVCRTRSGCFERSGFGTFSASTLIDVNGVYDEFGPPLLDLQNPCPSVKKDFREIDLY
jgi:hypothetical protein